MAKTYGWKGIERGLWDSRKFVCYAHPDYPQWQVYRPEGLNRPIRPYCFIGKSLPPELQRGFYNFTDIHNALHKLQNTRSAVDQRCNR